MQHKKTDAASLSGKPPHNAHRKGRPSLALAAATAMTLSGCSFQQTLNSMASAERQAEIIGNVQTLCSNPNQLQPVMMPELWNILSPQFPALANGCPRDPNTPWRITGYSFNTTANAGQPTQRTEEATVVAGSDAGPWSAFTLKYSSQGDGPALLYAVNGGLETAKPESLSAIETWDSIRWFVMAGVALVFLIPILLVIWFIRRRRRRRAAAQAGVGTSPTS